MYMEIPLYTYIRVLSKNITMTKEIKPKKPRADKKKNIAEELCGRCSKPKWEWEWYCNCWRPSKYDPKYCDDIIEYFERCQAEILVDIKFFQPNKNVTVETILNPLAKENDVDNTLQAWAVKAIDQKLVMQRFPTYVRYARSIGVSKSTLFEWANGHKEFSDAMGVCKDISEAILLENWLQGTYNSTFAQFLLKNNHWYKDKQETELSGTVEQTQTLSDKQMDAITSIFSALGKHE